MRYLRGKTQQKGMRWGEKNEEFACLISVVVYKGAILYTREQLRYNGLSFTSKWDVFATNRNLSGSHIRKRVS